MIYAIEADGLSLVKIGRSKDPIDRVASFQTSSPVRLTLLAAVDWDDEKEWLIHDIFADLRRIGEWFDFSPMTPLGYKLGELVQTMMCPNATKERKFVVCMEILQEAKRERRTMPFSEEVADLGLTKEDLARRLRVSPATVTVWGENPPPYVFAFLEIFRANKTLLDEMQERVQGLLDVVKDQAD